MLSFGHEHNGGKENPKVYYGEILPPRKPRPIFAMHDDERLRLVRLELQNVVTHQYTHNYITHYHISHGEQRRMPLADDPVDQITELVADGMELLGAGIVVTAELLVAGAKAYRAHRRQQAGSTGLR